MASYEYASQHTDTYCGWCQAPWDEHDLARPGELPKRRPGNEREWAMLCPPVNGVVADPDRDHGVRLLGRHWYVAETTLHLDLPTPDIADIVVKAWTKRVGKQYVQQEGLKSLKIMATHLAPVGAGHDPYPYTTRCDGCPPGFPTIHSFQCGPLEAVHGQIIDRRHGKGRRLTEPDEWDRLGGLTQIYTQNVDDVFVVTACGLCGGKAGADTWRQIKFDAGRTENWLPKRKLHRSGG